MAEVQIRGGKKLEEALGAIAKALGVAVRMVRVGFLENATYPDGKPVAMIAAIHNFGAPKAGIPPRPFFSNMVKEHSAAWPKEIAAALRATNFDSTNALAMMGDVIAGELRQSIIDFDATPLKPATIKRKGFAAQLIDTGHMLGSVDFEVKS